MAAIDVQHRSTFSNGTTSVALAYASNNTIHNLLVYASGGQVTGSSSTDSNTNTIVNAVSTGGQNFIDFVQDAHAGANTVTAHSGGTADIHLHIREISGCQTTTQPRDTGSVASSSTGSVTTAGATTQIGDAVVAIFDDEVTNDTLTADGSATDSELTQNNTGLDSTLSEFRSATASGAQTFTCGGNGANAMAQTIATFKVLATTLSPDDPTLAPVIIAPIPGYPLVNMGGMQPQDDPAGSLSATVDEYFWLNPGLMVIVYNQQPIPTDPEIIPAGKLTATVDEYFWLSTQFPPIPPFVQPPTIDEVIVPQPIPFTPNEEYRLEPLLPVSVLHIQPPWYDAGEIAITPAFVANEEGFWLNPVTPAMTIFYYQQPPINDGDGSIIVPQPPPVLTSGRSTRFQFLFPAFR